MTDSEVRLVRMSDAEVADWLPTAMAQYEQARLEAGDSPEQAAAGRRASEQRFFPDGRLVEGQLLHTIRLGDEEAGWLWLGPWDEHGELWWVWDLEVHPSFRRRGVARRAMLAGEEIAREYGASRLMLNVFGGNDGAIALYRDLGYAVASMHMAKPL
ncbi:GNAT family N-acetyltransferase [Agromyces sp. M3QZ16-3]|uniref:GNAT family N-acetyltransferase n=1 Tax=Agromyces sp. M3QZ16-3 TaxID=3447585 RepID=UPI003F691EE5